jgi:hypothetical protein
MVQQLSPDSKQSWQLLGFFVSESSNEIPS